MLDAVSLGSLPPGIPMPFWRSAYHEFLLIFFLATGLILGSIQFAEHCRFLFFRGPTTRVRSVGYLAVPLSVYSFVLAGFEKKLTQTNTPKKGTSIP
jgi:hypothetical protein